MICLGAATAANCIACFEYYSGKAEAVGLKTDEIQEAVDLASQVEKGAHIALRKSIGNMMGREKEYSLPCCPVTGRLIAHAAGSSQRN